MERVRRAIKTRQRSLSPSYEPLSDSFHGENEDSFPDSHTPKFSRLEYSIFLLLGVSMLWAWNMFLAAAPYFQHRFSHSPWLLTHFQPSILTNSTLTNLASMALLTHLQRTASYPTRITVSLILNFTAFTLLAISTLLFRSFSPEVYFAFLMVIVFAASLATGLCQNGVFAYVTSFGVGEYTQAIMTGQAIAGVLPCVAQIVSVLSVPEDDSGAGKETPKSAFAYFLTATIVSATTLGAFTLILLRLHPEDKKAAKTTVEVLDGGGTEEEDDNPERKVVGMWSLFLKLKYPAMAVFLCFAVTMLFPVFTQEILSVRPPSPSTPRLFRPACFIPLGFLFWNSGDLAGRLLTLSPNLKPLRYPRTLFLLSLLRLAFIPLYLLCNIKGRGAVVESDFFYLVVVQFLFGMSNGWLGSCCMIAAGVWVEKEEREAGGGFMGLMLVGGLSVGSLASFSVAGV